MKKTILNLFVLLLLGACAGVDFDLKPDQIAPKDQHSLSNELAKDWLTSPRNPERVYPSDNDSDYSLPYKFNRYENQSVPYKNPYNYQGQPYQGYDSYNNRIYPSDNDSEYYYSVPKSKKKLQDEFFLNFSGDAG